jgi:hypothetical protein
VLVHTAKRGPCEVCGGACVGYPVRAHPASYAFLEGGYELMAKVKVTTTERYFDKDGNLVYGEGQDADPEELKKLVPESKVGKAGPAPGEPTPSTSKKPKARTRARR